MPTDRPDAAELIEAVSEFLTTDVAPILEGRTAFQLRIALNLLATVQRTLSDGAAMDAEEQSRICDLLRTDGNLEELNARLADMIKAGELDGRSVEVLDHLRQTVKDKLRLANPRYMKQDGE